MIVINKNKIENFNLIKLSFQSEMQLAHIDIVPIEIKNDLYILNEDVLNHDIFKKIFETFNDYEIRTVGKDEFIKFELNF